MIKRILYFGNPAYLSLDNSNMVIRLPADPKQGIVSERSEEVITRTAVIEDLGFVVIDNLQITLTHGLIQALMENNVAVLWCSRSRMPSGLLLPMAGNTILSERYQAQINSSLPLRKQLWQQTVRAKIHNQGAVLKCLGKECGCMWAWEKEVKSNDAQAHEARAAVYYWRNIFPEDMEFFRDRFGESPNSMLNYGYAILRAIIARSLVCAGLLVALGIHHRNKYNAYCLADDIMEPYRPYVDRLILKLLEEHPEYRNSELNTEIKKALLAIPLIDVEIADARSPLMVAANRTATSLVKCYTGERDTVVYPKMRVDG